MIQIRSARRDLEGLILGGFTLVVLVLALLPIVLVVVTSFSASETLAFPPPGLSLRWYERTLNELIDPSLSIGGALGDALVTSILIALATAAVGLMIAVPMSYALVRYRFRGRLFFEQLLALPLVFPVIVIGIGLLVLASQIHFNWIPGRLIIAHVILTFPFLVRNCMASLHGVSETLEEAAMTLGASRIRAVWEVILPLVRPGMTAGLLLVFILSFNEFTASFFLYTASVQPFSMWLFQRAHTVIDPSITSISTFVIALNIALLLVLDRLVGSDRVAL
ncbi:MAG: ABC transporter permease [Chloroflexi bacterium]|nr:ABC transporter permease [Chloroflexota bacterium]